ncbi:hypothetical protein [Legionella tunisiensis]|uniref:hypothetical protein n=1 Tax=Legionella tunisiensis TaxID=1034944 RepID=UPI0002E836A9|nr:hypothetical protein [Legionella tunisiensis]
MKIKMVSATLLILLTLSLPSFAKIIIHGHPVQLDADGNYYDFPDDYFYNNPGNNYHYVILNGVRRVCYLSIKPELGALDRVRVLLEIKEQILPWYCYAFNPQFFEVDY